MNVKKYLTEVQQYIKDGLITERPHPEHENIVIYNYTPICQFKKKWDDMTTISRGLIINKDSQTILARPLPKFFNLGEHTGGLPKETPEIYEKLDGSLGILYFVNDEPWISTRGSMNSEQARWATKWFRENVTDLSDFDMEYTYLFEIIYPENRIVVSYDFSGLVFLTSIHKATGKSENNQYLQAVRNQNVARERARGYGRGAR